MHSANCTSTRSLHAVIHDILPHVAVEVVCSSVLCNGMFTIAFYAITCGQHSKCNEGMQLSAASTLLAGICISCIKRCVYALYFQHMAFDGDHHKVQSIE